MHDINKAIRPTDGQLRTECNKRGVSCRDEKGDFLSRRRLLNLLGRKDCKDIDECILKLYKKATN